MKENHEKMRDLFLENRKAKEAKGRTRKHEPGKQRIYPDTTRYLLTIDKKMLDTMRDIAHEKGITIVETFARAVIDYTEAYEKKNGRPGKRPQ